MTRLSPIISHKSSISPNLIKATIFSYLTIWKPLHVTFASWKSIFYPKAKSILNSIG